MKGLANLMKQAQEMQTNLQKARDELEKMEINGESVLSSSSGNIRQSPAG